MYSLNLKKRSNFLRRFSESQGNILAFTINSYIEYYKYINYIPHALIFFCIYGLDILGELVSSL